MPTRIMVEEGKIHSSKTNGKDIHIMIEKRNMNKRNLSRTNGEMLRLTMVATMLREENNNNRHGAKGPSIKTTIGNPTTKAGADPITEAEEVEDQGKETGTTDTKASKSLRQAKIGGVVVIEITMLGRQDE